MASRLPLPLRIARGLLWATAFFLTLSAVELFLLVRGAFGLGAAAVQLVPAVLSGLAAYRLPGVRRLGSALTLALVCFLALWQVGRLSAEQPAGLIGLALVVSIGVLLLLPPSRRHRRAVSAAS